MRINMKQNLNHTPKPKLEFESNSITKFVYYSVDGKPFSTETCMQITDLGWFRSAV